MRDGKDKALLRYHPERYRRTRPFSKGAVSLYRGLVGEGLPTKELLDAMSALVFETYNSQITLLPLEARPLGNTRRLVQEVSLACHYASFCVHGRNIFHLRGALVEEFLHTDVKNVPIGAVSFPYPCFYISFGPVRELSLYSKGQYIDGAYILVREGTPLQVVFTTYQEWDYEDPFEWIFKVDRYYYMSLEREDPLAVFGELIERSLEEELRQREEDQPSETGVHDVDGIKVDLIDRRAESAREGREEVLKGFDVSRTALNLVVNALCYISQYRDEIKEAWPEGTPESLLSKLRGARSYKQQRRILSKLVSMGYTKVKFCGGSFSRTGFRGTGREVRPHWRRGHWRLQPYGKGLEKRRLIWIRPTIVRKDKGMPESGHIYDVAKEEGGGRA